MLKYIVAAAVLAGQPLFAQQISWPAPERTVFRQPRSEIAISRVGGYPLVEVNVNGRNVRFALETGGSFVGVSSRLAQALGLTVRRADNTSALGPQQVTTIDSLRLGGVVFSGVAAAVSDRFEARDFDGIISPPLLREVMYTIDLRNNRLSLEQGALPPVDNQRVLPISRKDRGSRIDFPLTMGAVTVHPVLDTQSLMEVMIADSLESSMSLTSVPVSIGQASGPTQGTFTLRGARHAAAARLGSISLAGLPIIFRNRAGPIAGIAFLENFVITVDDKNGRIRFIPNADPLTFASASWESAGGRAARPPASGSSGRFMLGLRASGNPSTVVEVEKGSNIDRAGIRVGDVVLEVDGTPFQRMTPQDWQRVLSTGNDVKLALSRDGRRIDVSVTPIPREGATQPQETPRQEVERLNRSMEAAWQRNDAAAIAAHYADDARIIGPRGPAVEGRANIDNYWTRFPTEGRTWKLDVIEVGGTRELIYQFGRSTISGNGRSQSVDFVGIWRRQPNGQLKLAVDYYVAASR